jgi:hypothetical protein
MSPTKRRDEEKLGDARFAIPLSLIVGQVMLAGKVTAYFMTHSAAIFSDAAESVVHVVPVAFAAFSLRLSTKPAAPRLRDHYMVCRPLGRNTTGNRGGKRQQNATTNFVNIVVS